LSLPWPGSTINLTRDSRIKFSNYDNNHFYSYADLGQSDSWPGLCPESTPKLSFKTIIITIFISTWISLTILKLNVFYKDILEIKIKKYYHLRHVPYLSCFEIIKINYKIILIQIHFYIFIFIFFNQTRLYYFLLFYPNKVTIHFETKIFLL
jgi:hypothetical protein